MRRREPRWILAFLLLAWAPSGVLAQQAEVGEGADAEAPAEGQADPDAAPTAPDAAPAPPDASPSAPDTAPAPEAPPAGLVPPRVREGGVVRWPEGVPAPEAGVEVLLTVTTDGRAEEVELAGDVLPAAAREAVLEAAAALRFEPALRDGVPVAGRIRYRFALAAPAPAPAAPAAGSPGTGDAAGPSGAGDAAAPTAPPPVVELPPEAETPSFGVRARVDPPDPGAATEVQLRGAELTMVPGTFGEPLRVVATLPGVARTPFGLGFFAVRGANLQNTGFLVDGFPVPLLYHLGAGPAILSSRLVDGLDFYAGGYPLPYGRFTAGLVSLSTAPPPADRWFLEFEVDLLKASAMAVVPFDDGRGSVAVALRRSYYELILPLVTDAVSVSYSDYQVRADYRFTDRLSASLFVFGSRDSLQFSQEIGAGQTTGQAAGGLTYSFDRVIGSVRYRASDAVRLKWSATAGPSGIDFGSESTGDASFGVDTDSLRLGQRLEAQLSPAPAYRTTVGVEQNLWINALTGRAPSFGELPGVEAPDDTRESIAVRDRLIESTVAPYFEQVLRPGPFVITGGLRAEHYEYGNVSTWAWEPRGVVRLKLTDATTLKAASGLFSQAPLPYQYNRSFGNPQLRPNRGWQSSVGTEVALMEKLSLDTSLFYNRMWQLTRASDRPAVDEDGNAILRFFEDDGEGRAYGWELLLRRKVERGLLGWLSYTLSRSERFLDGGQVQPFFFDQTHVLNLAVSYDTGAWTFGARFSLATGRPSNDQRLDADWSNRTFDADEVDYDIDGRGRSVRLPTFHQLDLRVDRKFTLGPVEGSMYLDVINAYAAPNSEGYVYEYDFSRRGRVPGLPFLPTIGVRGVLQ